ncbi:MAG: sugar porter family MFS transporter [Pseudomonadota bacterium]
MTRKNSSSFYIFKIALIAALGGFLMGFDASVISGVVKFIEPEFELTKLQLGWAVASLSLTATFAMMVTGPLSDKFGRKLVLHIAAVVFFVSALGSAFAPDFLTLVLARMLGGFGVGAALIIAPMYIAEIAPANLRGRMVSLNQLNIVLGISVAFFTNYMVLQLASLESTWALTAGFEQWNWRWMLGLEMLPAMLYFIGLIWVPESPRWLVMQRREDEALAVLSRASHSGSARAELKSIVDALDEERQRNSGDDGKSILSKLKTLSQPSMRLVMIVGISIAVLQQITGINAVFFYAPMIFELSGLGTDAAFMQAILVGLTNLVFTLVAISLIDRLGRKLLLTIGVSGIAVCMFCLSYGFGAATYTLKPETVKWAEVDINRASLVSIFDVTFDDELAYKAALKDLLGDKAAIKHESLLVSSAIDIDQTLILLGIVGFVACFAMSLGPVMWVLFSELFPNQIRGIAISFVGLINSGVSFGVQLVFPWEISKLGSTLTFSLYGVFALIGLIIILKFLPETKGKSLEELSKELVATP